MQITVGAGASPAQHRCLFFAALVGYTTGMDSHQFPRWGTQGVSPLDPTKNFFVKKFLDFKKLKKDILDIKVFEEPREAFFKKFLVWGSGQRPESRALPLEPAKLFLKEKFGSKELKKDITGIKVFGSSKNPFFKKGSWWGCRGEPLQLAFQRKPPQRRAAGVNNPEGLIT